MKNTVFTKRKASLFLIMFLAAAILFAACGQSASGNEAQGTVTTAAPEAAPTPEPTPEPEPTPSAESIVSSFTGEWVEVFSGFKTPGQAEHIVLSEDGNYTRGETSGIWWPDSEGREIWLDYQFVFTRLEEDGFTMLARFREPYGTEELLVRAEDYEAYVDHYFMIVEITPENLRNYIAEPVYLTTPVDEWGEPLSTIILIWDSLIFKDGFTYVARSDDFKYEMIRNSLMDGKIVRSESVTELRPFHITSMFPKMESYSMGERAMGSLVFVRPGFVRSNTVGDSFRRVEMTSGIVFAEVRVDWIGIEEFYPDHMF